MAGFELPLKEGRVAKSAGKAKGVRKRIGIRIDMTPMVDIAFLLLIFYMVTTVFSMPQSLELNLPPKNSNRSNIAESRVLHLWVDSDGGIFWMHNKSAEERMLLPRVIQRRDLRSFLIAKNSEIDGLVTLLKIDPDSRYEILVNLIDEIQIVERLFKQIDPEWSYRLSIDDISRWEIEQMSMARSMMGNKSS